MSAAHTGTLYSQFVFNIKLEFSDLYTYSYKFRIYTNVFPSNFGIWRIYIFGKL